MQRDEDKSQKMQRDEGTYQIVVPVNLEVVGEVVLVEMAYKNR